MYKRDYHPDENIVFKTKNYNFDAPKSTPLEPLSNALVQIDKALKKEETDRIAEDVRINARVDKEVVDRTSEDGKLAASIAKETSDRIDAINDLAEKSVLLSALKIQAGYENSALNILPVYQCNKECYSLAFAKVTAESKYFYILIPENTTNIEISDIYAPQIAGKSVYRYSIIRDDTLDENGYIGFRTHARLTPFVTLGVGTAVVIHFSIL
jgi:hypothetical protein